MIATVFCYNWKSGDGWLSRLVAMAMQFAIIASMPNEQGSRSIAEEREKD
jgi:hypothetical protein